MHYPESRIIRKGHQICEPWPEVDLVSKPYVIQAEISEEGFLANLLKSTCIQFLNDLFYIALDFTFRNVCMVSIEYMKVYYLMLIKMTKVKRFLAFKCFLFLYLSISDAGCRIHLKHVYISKLSTEQVKNLSILRTDISFL